jgi:hypothetical protein
METITMSKKNTNAQTVEQSNETTQTVAKTYDVSALLNEHKTKSAVIRYLASQGETVASIHKILVSAGWKSEKSGEPIRYQHVRNVLKTPAKRQAATAPVASEEPKTE